MIFDELNLPRDTGATDLQDSARLAGVMVAFNSRSAGGVDLSKYVVDSFKLAGVSVSRVHGGRRLKTYVRHPSEYIYDFSRDQAICLMAGLFFQGKKELVCREYVNGKDFFSPSHWGHVRLCQGLAAKWYQKLWLWVDVLWSVYVHPTKEPNQLLCMLRVADPKYMRFWLKNNTAWRSAVLDYWCGWRNEPDLAWDMIHFLEENYLPL